MNLGSCFRHFTKEGATIFDKFCGSLYLLRLQVSKELSIGAFCINIVQRNDVCQSFAPLLFIERSILCLHILIYKTKRAFNSNVSVEEIILIHKFCIVASLKSMVDTTYFISTIIADQDILHTEVLAHRLDVLVFCCIYQ